MYSSKCFGVCVMISTFLVRCLNIEETTFVKKLKIFCNLEIQSVSKALTCKEIYLYSQIWLFCK